MVIGGNATVEGGFVPHGSFATFDCDGTVSVYNTSYCSNGTWSHPLPTCIQGKLNYDEIIGYSLYYFLNCLKKVGKILEELSRHFIAKFTLTSLIQSSLIFHQFWMVIYASQLQRTTTTFFCSNLIVERMFCNLAVTGEHT